MRTLLIIGIGAGHPDHLTLQAVDAMRRAAVFFVMDKGPAKHDLAELRRAMLERHLGDRPYRVVEAPVPERDVAAADYRAAVAGLNRDKRALYARLIAAELPADGCGAILVWGDPSLYDSTVRIVADLAVADPDGLAFEIVPGITSLQALAAAHRTTLTRIAEPFLVTTGRQLAAGFPADADNVAVMLDGDTAFRHLADRDDLHIEWGAFVGTEREILVSGPLREVAGEIVRRRAEARAAHGWIMDSYVLRRMPTAEPATRADRPPAGPAPDRR